MGLKIPLVLSTWRSDHCPHSLFWFCVLLFHFETDRVPLLPEQTSTPEFNPPTPSFLCAGIAGLYYCIPLACTLLEGPHPSSSSDPVLCSFLSFIFSLDQAPNPIAYPLGFTFRLSLKSDHCLMRLQLPLCSRGCHSTDLSPILGSG